MSKNEKNLSSGIVEDDPHLKAGHRGFQSKDAMLSATKPSADDDEGPYEPQSAEVADFTDNHRPPPAMTEDPMRMVRVRSREYIAPFFYGKKQYSLPAGKDVLLPLGVKRHLEEKGQL